jgi:hypothetical protein
MTIVIDPSKKGLEKVLRDYQIEALNIIWKSDNNGMTSREVYQAVNRSLGSKTISRASIINFLNDMVDENVLKYEEETCKGGTRRKYFTGLDETGFKKHIATVVFKSLMRDFPVQTKEAVVEVLNDN